MAVSHIKFGLKQGFNIYFGSLMEFLLVYKPLYATYGIITTGSIYNGAGTACETLAVKGRVQIT